ncbi:MAG: hypothetical protein HKN17_00225 [Rhodothermales bacterium]|nr:hypothetical protein [Rhodothermales bacterium]
MSVSSVFVRYAAAALGLVGMIYAAPVLLGRRPKEVHRLKNVLIAACWVTGGVVVPLIESNAPTVVILWLVIHRLFCIAPDLVAADLVDRRGDIAAGVRDDVRIHPAHPQRVAVRSLAAAATLALVAVVSGWSPSGPGGLLLVAIDMLGLAGTAWTLRGIERLHHRHVVLLDIWVAFPLVTWLASLCM